MGGRNNFVTVEKYQQALAKSGIPMLFCHGCTIDAVPTPPGTAAVLSLNCGAVAP